MGKLEDFLEERKRLGLLRTLRPAELRSGTTIRRDGAELTDFSSNDYLSLSQHPRLKEASKKAAEELGAGACASRLLSGDLKIHHDLEEKTAHLKGKESALVFNSGYQANVGVISAICGPGDAVFSDRLNHASIIDGILLSGARLFRFDHNDAGHLETLLEKHAARFENRLIVTETIFSMDGDRPPLKDIVRLKEKYGCQLMVDEAHATGIFGENGSGVAAEEGLTDRIEVIMGTFGKALGGFGAYVAATKTITQYLINSCRSFIYSTALPPSVIAADLAALELLKNEPFRRKTLLENAAYFQDELQKRGFEIHSRSQIIPVVIGNAEKTAALSSLLCEQGFFVPPIRPPTVPEGSSRLRFSVCYGHDRPILVKLADCLDKACHV